MWSVLTLPDHLQKTLLEPEELFGLARGLVQHSKFVKIHDIKKQGVLTDPEAFVSQHSVRV